MTGLLKLISVLLPLLYGLAWANYALLFYRDDPVSRRTATPLLASVVGLHLLGLIVQAAALRRCPMGNLPEVLSVIALAVVAIYLVLEALQRNPYTGVFLLGLVTPIIVVSSSLTPPTAPVSPLLKSPLFSVHTFLALTGYAAFAVSMVYGVMFLLLHRTLKRQNFGLVFQRLPSLEGLAQMTVGAAVIGFSALTLTIMVGMVWGSHALQTSQLPAGSFWRDPKIALTLLVWVAYGLGLLSRFVLRLSERHTVTLLVAAFVVAVLVMVALNTVLHTFHNFST